MAGWHGEKRTLLGRQPRAAVGGHASAAPVGLPFKTPPCSPSASLNLTHSLAGTSPCP